MVSEVKANVVRARFSPGHIVATPGALELLLELDVSPSGLLDRHVTGDWGDLDDEDKSVNEAALRDGSRIMSAYNLNAHAKGVDYHRGHRR